MSEVIHRYKSFTTTKHRQGVHHNGWPHFPGKLWQRSYFDRIIRNEPELAKIRQYILTNPLRWQERD